MEAVMQALMSLKGINDWAEGVAVFHANDLDRVPQRLTID